MNLNANPPEITEREFEIAREYGGPGMERIVRRLELAGRLKIVPGGPNANQQSQITGQGTIES